MLTHLRRLSINFLLRPIGTAVLVWIAVILLLFVQSQPWSLLERILLAILPAVGPALLAAGLHPRFFATGKTKRDFYLPAALALWLILLFDIGWSFLSWALVFGIAALLLQLLAPRFVRALAAGMILFGAFYLTLRLHQAEQMGWLHVRVSRQARAIEARTKTEIDHDTIHFFFDGRDLLSTRKPQDLNTLEKTSEEDFPGLNPLILLSSNPRDERAIPLVGLLSVPGGFPAELWKIQLESTLAQFRRDGRIGEPKFTERKATCGAFECQESLWVYEDKFQGRLVQTGYALILLSRSGTPGSKSGAGSGENQNFAVHLPKDIGLMVWFREPFVEGLPHSPAVLDFVKNLRPTSEAGKAN